MDRIRTLLLARSHVVVVDPDLAASAATAPSRDLDFEKLEDELAQRGFVMSLDLAITVRRLPHHAIEELRDWMFATLATPAAARPVVPVAAPVQSATPREVSRYLRRILPWLATSREQPCPWCGELEEVGALDPCGHLVCPRCWKAGSFAGCPICHRRVALGVPFVRPSDTLERVTNHAGTLALLHIAFDLVGTAQQRFQALLARGTPLDAGDRAELEVMIDTIGPRAAAWLPARIPVAETRAIALARLWANGPDRTAIVRQTAAHATTASDVLRVAAVLMSGNAALREPMRLTSLPRTLRRAILDALAQLPLEEAVEHMYRRRRLWKRVGERLHPFELVAELPGVAVAFAAVRRTNLARTTIGVALRAHAVRLPFVYVEDDVIKPIAWAGTIEDALRAGNPRSALARLTHRPAELLRRADQLVRAAQLRQLDALQTVVKAVELAALRGPPAALLATASHFSRRARPWPRRVFFPASDTRAAWGVPDDRVALRGDAIAVIVGSIRRHLVARAEKKRQFPRAVIDRALVDLLLPGIEGAPARGKVVWPRGSEVALPDGAMLRLLLHWEQPANARVDLDLAVVLYDARWRHVATCDAANLAVGTAAVHSGDREQAPGPRGATEHVDLHLEQLALAGARHAVMAVWAPRTVLGRLPVALAGIAEAPRADRPLEPRAIEHRFDLIGRGPLLIPLAIDLAERRLRWLGVRPARAALRRAGGYRAALAHAGRDVADLVVVHARPTMWDLACIHAAARATTVYVRERDGSFTIYRHRDHESKLVRLGRLMSGASDDGRVAAIPVADVPTWFALVRGMALPPGSRGYVLDARSMAVPEIDRASAADLVAELGPLR